MRGDFSEMQAQMHDCIDCLKTFLVKAVDKQPELIQHAEIIHEHLETLLRELDVWRKENVIADAAAQRRPEFIDRWRVVKEATARQCAD